mmetsp:Transcript_900/g.1856  ORF Transcript_900/g.1856 Transcript_900/m.1856 type:complete len:451 (-) Transcript_900:348-1700(-)
MEQTPPADLNAGRPCIHEVGAVGRSSAGPFPSRRLPRAGSPAHGCAHPPVLLHGGGGEGRLRARDRPAVRRVRQGAHRLRNHRAGVPRGALAGGLRAPSRRGAGAASAEHGRRVEDSPPGGARGHQVRLHGDEAADGGDEPRSVAGVAPPGRDDVAVRDSAGRSGGLHGGGRPAGALQPQLPQVELRGLPQAHHRAPGGAGGDVRGGRGAHRVHPQRGGREHDEPHPGQAGALGGAQDDARGQPRARGPAPWQHPGAGPPPILAAGVGVVLAGHVRAAAVRGAVPEEDSADGAGGRRHDRHPHPHRQQPHGAVLPRGEQVRRGVDGEGDDRLQRELSVGAARALQRGHRRAHLGVRPVAADQRVELLQRVPQHRHGLRARLPPLHRGRRLHGDCDVDDALRHAAAPGPGVRGDPRAGQDSAGADHQEHHPQPGGLRRVAHGQAQRVGVSM